MTAHIPKPPDPETLLAMVRLARRVLDALPKGEVVPRVVQRELATFYNLTDYHGIAPSDAPHIPDDGLI